ncbi:unnamed protein product [Effrenium voratum]|uniref:Methyltransferase type 11 domain-containing protein n=1 Tax=Effrenium voratum TaxID=2562239 RepID=A0AA36N3Q0_9DINO|nr:unnamed protein product [Effrenium voratum]
MGTDKISGNFAASRRFPWPFVVRWLEESQGGRLLVAGCGDGRHVDTALGLGKFEEVLAMDLSGGMLQAARRRLGSRSTEVTYLQADTRQVPLPPASVEEVLSCAVLHHLPLNESLKGLRELARVLKPGGRLLASCWDPRAKAVAKRGRPAEGAEDAFWVAWRCSDGSDVQRWYHLPSLERRTEYWSQLDLDLRRAELDGDNQVFEWVKVPAL